MKIKRDKKLLTLLILLMVVSFVSFISAASCGDGNLDTIPYQMFNYSTSFEVPNAPTTYSHEAAIPDGWVSSNYGFADNRKSSWNISQESNISTPYGDQIMRIDYGSNAGVTTNETLIPYKIAVNDTYNFSVYVSNIYPGDTTYDNYDIDLIACNSGDIVCREDARSDTYSFLSTNGNNVISSMNFTEQISNGYVVTAGGSEIGKYIGVQLSAPNSLYDNFFFSVTRAEQCDDGNTVSGDGCSSQCLLEPRPEFSTYQDNNGTLIDSGIGVFNVTVEDTNGTVLLEINGENITATNLTLNIYNASYNFTTSGFYPYRWHSWGNGTEEVYNFSSERIYAVLGRPNTTQISINSSSENNFTSENLQCYARGEDREEGVLTAFIKWYKNGIFNLSQTKTSLTNGSLELVSTLDSGNTSVGENWTCSVLFADSSLNETEWNNVSLEIIGGCGDGIIQSGESCDGTNFGSLGSDCSGWLDDNEGSVTCNSDCTINYGGCSEVESSVGARGIGYPTYNVDSYKLEKGYTQIIRENWKVKLMIDNETHTLIVNSIGGDIVNFSIFSEEQNFLLNVGEEKKIDVLQDGYYDLLINLNSITENSISPSASITLNLINEEVPFNEVDEDFSEQYKDTGKSSLLFILLILSGVVLVTILIITLIHKNKKIRNQKKKKRR